MALNYVGPGDTIPVTGIASTISSGALYKVGVNATDHEAGWWGVVQDEIIGTSNTLTTIDGRPILDEDLTGLNIQGVNVGDGKGELAVVGVHEFIIASGVALAGSIAKGHAVYASGTNTVAGPTIGLRGDYDITPGNTYGMVQHQTAYTTYGASGGLSLVGHVWKDPFLDLRTASNTKGTWVVETKLFGCPVQGLV